MAGGRVGGKEGSKEDGWDMEREKEGCYLLVSSLQFKFQFHPI